MKSKFAREDVEAIKRQLDSLLGYVSQAAYTHDEKWQITAAVTMLRRAVLNHSHDEGEV